MFLAALEMRKMTRSMLAEQVGRSVSAISDAIRGKGLFRSKSLEKDIVDALQPELDLIHNIFKDVPLEPQVTTVKTH